MCNGEDQPVNKEGEVQIGGSCCAGLCTVRLGKQKYYFQSTPFALKLRGHFVNISMMIIAKGI